MDKNKAIVEYLMGCPYINNNPLFFNFINAKDNDKQIATVLNDKVMDKAFINGAVMKRFTFTIIDYKSIAYSAIPKMEGYPNENIEDMLDSQSIIDWITEQEELHNYPDFGTDCVIEDMRALSDNPNLNGVNTQVSPTLAKYSVTIQINYIDNSKATWK